MKDKYKTKEQLIKELAEARQQIAGQEFSQTEDTENWVQALANNLTIGIYIVQEGKFRFANSMFQKYVGYSEEELMGIDSLRLVYSEDRDMVRENAVKMLKGNSSASYEFRYVNKNRECFWVMESVTSVQYQGRRATLGNLLDITKRKRLEEELRRSEERMRAFTGALPDVAFVIDKNGRYIEVLNSMEDLLYKETYSIVGQTLHDVLPRKVADLGLDAVRRAIETRQTQSIEYQLDVPLGLRLFEARLSSILTGDSDNNTVAVIVRDITEQRRIEDALRQSKEKYRQLLEDMSDGYVVIQGGKYVFANRRFGEIFGYEPEQLVEKPIAEFTLPGDHQTVIEQYEKMMCGEELASERFEGKALKKDGTEIIAEASIKPIQYEGKPALSVVVRDITEHKRAEEKIKQAAEEWKITFDSISDLISIHDRDFRIVRVNNAVASVLNLKPQELVGKKCYEVFHGTSEPVPDCPHIQMLKTKETASGEFFEPHLGIYLEVATSPILSNESNILGSVHIARNVTERKRAEENLKELYEREIELREELEAERRTRIEFTRVLVHELKTPLTPMLASSQLLLEELHGEETLLRLAKNISQGTLNLSNRVDELFDLMRGETGKLRLKIESVDPLPLLQIAAEAMAPMASSNGLSLILDLPPFLPSVRADQGRLQQIILNLLNNASKFTPKGGEITLRARKNDDALVVEVQDTGHGITKEEHERIFDPYHRVENDRQRFSGMGLGLALCKKLVEYHGGQIWVKSRPNEGSTFGFSLPLEDCQ